MAACTRDLGEEFRAFCASLEEPPVRQAVDFLGINVSDDTAAKPVFKIYYSRKFSGEERHPVQKMLSERGMLRYCSLVRDTVNRSCVRLDLALKERTDRNMEWLFEQLTCLTTLFREGEGEIRELARMQITDREQHRNSTLYHLGFTEQDEEITLLKCHFLTRWCPDPDQPGKDSEYRDRNYLEYLKNCKIAAYVELAGLAETALNQCGGHLWMAGLDMGAAGYRKYKLYIKQPSMLYERLPGILGETMAEPLKASRRWHQAHPEYGCEGAAFCVDSDSVHSLNLYYGWK